MWELLHKNESWENPPTPLIDEGDLKDEDDDEDHQAENPTGQTTSELSELLQEVNSSEDQDSVASGISDLFSAGLISDKQKESLTVKHKTAFKRVPCNTIPMFEETNKKARSPLKHSPYVVIQVNGKDYCINKTTVVWLLQEGERVSCDRLFRVRSKQPYTNDSVKSVPHPVGNEPAHCDKIAVGDLCVFQVQGTSNWRVGKVLKFCYYKQKAMTCQQYRGSAAKVMSTEHIGVLCSWYSEVKEGIFSCLPTSDTREMIHTYVPTSLYLCTLTNGCFKSIEKNLKASSDVEVVPSGVYNERLSLTTAYELTLTQEALANISDILEVRMKAVVEFAKDRPESVSLTTENCWVQYGGHVLNRKHM